MAITDLIPQLIPTVPGMQPNNAAPVDEKQRLLDILFQQPKDDIPELSNRRQMAGLILTGLADALNAGRAAKRRGPGPTQYAGQYMGMMDELRQRRQQTKDKADQVTKAKAAYRLGEISKEQERKEAAAMRAQEKADQLAFRAEDREDRQKFEAAQNEADKAFREAQAKADRDFKAYQEQRDRDLRLKLENIERSAVGDKVKEKQVEQQRDLLAGTRLKMATEAKAMLRDNPDVNVDELRQDYLDEMKAVGMDPEYIESALAYFDDIAARYKKPEQPVSDGGVGIGKTIKNVIGGLGRGASATAPSPSQIAAQWWPKNQSGN